MLKFGGICYMVFLFFVIGYFCCIVVKICNICYVYLGGFDLLFVNELILRSCVVCGKEIDKIVSRSRSSINSWDVCVGDGWNF